MKILVIGSLDDNIYFKCSTCGSVWLASESDCLDESNFDNRTYICLCPKCHRRITSVNKLTKREVEERLRLYDFYNRMSEEG